MLNGKHTLSAVSRSALGWMPSGPADFNFSSCSSKCTMSGVIVPLSNGSVTGSGLRVGMSVRSSCVKVLVKKLFKSSALIASS